MGFHHHYVHGPRLMPRLLGGVSTGALTLLGSEADGLSIDFTDASIVVRDTTTTSNAYNGDVQTFWRDRSFTSYASPSPKITRDSAGLYTYRPHNLVAMSEKLAVAGYWQTNSSSITTDATTAPDGTTTADKITEAAANAVHGVQTVTTVTITNGIPYTFSFYLKAAGRSYLAVQGDGGAGNLGGVSGFDLVTPAATAAVGCTATITDVGSGWFRCTVTATSSGATALPYFSIRTSAGTSHETYVGDGSSGIYLWGAQLNVGPTALTYTKTQAHNLLQQSQVLDNAIWSNTGSSETANSTTAPDGTATAEKLVESATNNRHEIWQAFTGTADPTTYSVYVKAAERTFCSVYYEGPGGVFHGVCVNLTTGAIGTTTGTLTSSAITACGNGWHRVSITKTLTASVGWYVVIGTATADGAVPETYNGDGASGIYVWGAQRELASSAGKYVATTTAAVYSNRYELPREWDSSGACQGLLVEEARTNLLTYSTQFDNAAWTKSSATITADNTTGPDGQTTADLLTSTLAGGWVIQAITGVISTTYTCSCFFKAGTHNIGEIYIGGGGVGGVDSGYKINLTTGELTKNGAGSITATATQGPSGWWRLAVTFTTSGADNTFEPLFRGDENSTGTVYIWGAQLEAGAFATSPIYTGSASVTRAADNIDISTGVYPYSASLSTVYGSATPAGSSWQPIMEFATSTGSRYHGIRRNNSDTYGSVLPDGATGINGGAWATGTTSKLALASAASDHAFVVGGSVAGTNAAVAMATANRVKLGVNGTPSEWFNGHIRQIMLLPRRMSNADMQTLTT
jgi:hypothetical protein